MILFLLSSISELVQKQSKRMHVQDTQRKTRSSNENNNNNNNNNKDEEKQTNFVIVMDNYFTLPRVISALCDKGIGIVGTAKYQRAWPPTELKQVSEKESCRTNGQKN